MTRGMRYVEREGLAKKRQKMSRGDEVNEGRKEDRELQPSCYRVL